MLLKMSNCGYKSLIKLDFVLVKKKSNRLNVCTKLVFYILPNVSKVLLYPPDASHATKKNVKNAIA